MSPSDSQHNGQRGVPGSVTLVPSQADSGALTPESAKLLSWPEDRSKRSSISPSTRSEADASRGTVPSLPATSLSSATSSCEAALCQVAHVEASEPVLLEAGRRWAARTLADRLAVFRKARHWMAANSALFARAISPELTRAGADTLVTELLPLLEAIRFLERKARGLLAPRRLGAQGRPLWLTGVGAEVHHEPLGHILVIGPSNFPLFLPGVQTVQALVAGNAVTWKPGAGGKGVAVLFAHALREAGLPRGILHIADESIEAAESALAQHPDKVVFTGSYDTGRRILSTLAETATPAVMELSGTDAVVVLPSADLALVAKAVAFGLRLNGAEVCMSPRRLIATRETLALLRPYLQAELAQVPPVTLKPRTAEILNQLLREALQGGATLASAADAELSASVQARSESTLSGSPGIPASARPLLLDRATPAMAITQTDLFAPVLSLIEAPSALHLADLVNNNPYALTAAIFGASREAEVLATQLRVGTVLINDLIAPTADPRVPFGGRRHSGFGLTRGGEGLLEMTSTKTILIRRRGSTRHYDPLGPGDLLLFTGLIGALHGGSLAGRWRAVKELVAAGRSRSQKIQQSSSIPVRPEN